ncbi:ATPase AAA [Calothrix sp. 336/3]|nr:ATPase AAA [Calothrix sp. 336/3]
MILLIGLPGSGKSTLAQKILQECPQMRLLGTDAIRGQLFGNEAIQGSWLLIWREIRRQFSQAQSQNQSIIFDATNAQRRQRRDMINLARDSGMVTITAIWLQTPVWLCLARNRNRGRKVPEDVIFRMYRQLRDVPPSTTEGIDHILTLM